MTLMQEDNLRESLQQQRLARQQRLNKFVAREGT
jgi:hypothetical protein